MSNHPNMSYCMFQNTRLAMEQLIEAMNEAVNQGPNGIRDFFQDLDRSERQAFSDIFNMCEDYMNLADELEEARDTEEIS